jgi:transitional endoplasmic reticulum ATPase
MNPKLQLFISMTTGVMLVYGALSDVAKYGQYAVIALIIISGVMMSIFQSWIYQITDTSPHEYPDFDAGDLSMQSKKNFSFRNQVTMQPVNYPSTQKNVGEEPSHNFSNVVGMQDLKDRLLRAGEEIVDSDESSFSSRNGILLYGPPGTGKTFFAEALAGELGLKIIKVNFGELASRWVNQTTERVMEVMTQAQQSAPVVLFMDEIDAIIPDRAKASSSDSESVKLVSSFLPKIEALRKAGVVIIGATNLMDSLDPAAIREGRFDYKIEVPYPDEAARYAVAKARMDKHTKNGFPLAIKKEVLEKTTKRWRGFSIARINAIIDEVVELIERGKLETERTERGSYILTADLLQNALRSIQGRNCKPSETAAYVEDLIIAKHLQDQLFNITYRMKNIEESESFGAEVPRGILFAGPPGTGKTFTAKALANSADWAFIDTTGHELLNDAKKVDAILKKAGDMRPCVIFIDEADDVFTDRNNSSPYASSVTNKLLSAMDGTDNRMPDIVFIAATNHPDRFDPAALRAGRFTEKVMFELPSKAEIIKWIGHWYAKKNPAMFDSELNVEVISDQLLGLSIANIKGVMQHAINTVVTRSSKVITLEDIKNSQKIVTGSNIR